MAFERVSISKKVQGWCGWSFLLEIIDACRSPFERGLVATLFETGCRVSELLMLRKDNFLFDQHPELIVVDGAPVLKKYEKVDEIPDPKKKSGKKWITKPVERYRTFPIKKSEPLVEPMLEWLDKVERGKLFPQFDKVKNKRHKVLHIIRKIGSRIKRERIPYTRVPPNKLWPHWFRDQRARQLTWDYGFAPIDLAGFFNWEMPQLGVIPHYTKPDWRELAKKMGVDIRDEMRKLRGYK